ncbi:MAG: hypothetical protein WDN75_09480 [Bacteroidota bacterium]
MEPSFLTTVQKTEIDHVDISKEGGYGSTGVGGVIAFYSKRFASDPIDVKGIVKIKYPGLSRVREFYSPNYEIENARHKYPDLRRTLYWNSSIQTNTDGVFEVSFYGADVLANYLVVIEGISAFGIPSSTRETILVSSSK